MSLKERVAIKKYLGVWRWESELDSENVSEDGNKAHKQEQAKDKRISVWSIFQYNKKEHKNTWIVWKPHVTAEYYQK